MIFFLVDYIKYNFMWGNYSIKALEEQGLELCNDKNIEYYMTKTKPMDIILFHTRKSFLSWLVMYYTNSTLSHCALLLENNMVLEANLNGVEVVHIRDFVDNKSYFLLKTSVKPLTDKEIKYGLEFSERQVGKGYNWLGVILLFFSTIFANDDKWRLRYSLDIYILLFTLNILSIISAKFFYSLFIIYTVIILFHLISRFVNKIKFIKYVQKYVQKHGIKKNS